MKKMYVALALALVSLLTANSLTAQNFVFGKAELGLNQTAQKPSFNLDVNYVPDLSGLNFKDFNLGLKLASHNSNSNSVQTTNQLLDYSNWKVGLSLNKVDSTSSYSLSAGFSHYTNVNSNNTFCQFNLRQNNSALKSLTAQLELNYSGQALTHNYVQALWSLYESSPHQFVPLNTKLSNMANTTTLEVGTGLYWQFGQTTLGGLLNYYRQDSGLSGVSLEFTVNTLMPF